MFVQFYKRPFGHLFLYLDGYNYALSFSMGKFCKSVLKAIPIDPTAEQYKFQVLDWAQPLSSPFLSRALY